MILNATPDQPQMPIEEYDWDFYQSMLDFFIKSPYCDTRRDTAHEEAALGSHHQHRFGGVSSGRDTVHRLRLGQGGGRGGFNRSLAHELAPWNITVNMIAPGLDTPVERHEKDRIKDGYCETRTRAGAETQAAMIIYVSAGEYIVVFKLAAPRSTQRRAPDFSSPVA